MKKCTKCQETKSRDAFPKQGSGRGTWCKTCRAISERLRRSVGGDAMRERNRARTRTEPERHVRNSIIQRCTNPNDPAYENLRATRNFDL